MDHAACTEMEGQEDRLVADHMAVLAGILRGGTLSEVYASRLVAAVVVD